ncbi:PREDICTED: tripartite motif-containing protein 14-like [Nanorana parkeri]|uniref:tripartite motif-containing protein 14-like n=1 Tax=Nanorana parkeri TaxID=125878 RepID=UPI000854E30A|nr:PREDICTED: tripartite motif-containing protein 14-like [Nanorana parkeri]
MCEASLCDDHLRVHSKSPEHILTEPTTSMESRKCSVHKKILEYYCLADSACICVSCRLDGEHQGHTAELLHEASEKKKQKLKNVLQKLITEREETEKRVRSLQERRRKVQERAAGVTTKVTSLFEDTRRQAEDLQKKVHNMISRQEERLSLPVSDLIQKLEIKKAELSRKMDHIEEMCNMTDPLTVLQESDTGDLCDTEEGDDEDRERHDKLLHDGRNLDVAEISHTLHSGLSNMIKGVNAFLHVQAADILLDVNTAHHKLHLSGDMKTASWSNTKQNHPETSGKFQTYYQVLGMRSFFSGRHYWELDVSESTNWAVGMSYAGIDKRGRQSAIGYNRKSWSLSRYENECSVIHNEEKVPLADNISSDKVRIYLDYKAGQLFFYDMCEPIRHLHTFTTTFTEPLHAALCVSDGSIKISGKVMDNPKSLYVSVPLTPAFSLDLLSSSELILRCPTGFDLWLANLPTKLFLHGVCLRPAALVLLFALRPPFPNSKGLRTRIARDASPSSGLSLRYSCTVSVSGLRHSCSSLPCALLFPTPRVSGHELQETPLHRLVSASATQEKYQVVKSAAVRLCGHPMPQAPTGVGELDDNFKAARVHLRQVK